MQLKLFILPVKNLDAAEAEMNAFLRSHRVLTVKKEFVADGENSFWTFCVEFLESAPGGPGGASLSGRPKVDYKEVLKPEEFEVFSRLREWRKGVAEKEGVPVYVVFSNEQLAEMVRQRVASQEQLKQIEGVGEARVEKYGAAVLERLVFNPVPG
jgi:superfamily II DNA helicase RecQ